MKLTMMYLIKAFLSGLTFGVRIYYHMLQGMSFKECIRREFNEDLFTFRLKYYEEAREEE